MFSAWTIRIPGTRRPMIPENGNAVRRRPPAGSRTRRATRRRRRWCGPPPRARRAGRAWGRCGRERRPRRHEDERGAEHHVLPRVRDRERDVGPARGGHVDPPADRHDVARGRLEPDRLRQHDRAVGAGRRDVLDHRAPESRLRRREAEVRCRRRKALEEVDHAREIGRRGAPDHHAAPVRERDRTRPEVDVRARPVDGEISARHGRPSSRVRGVCRDAAPARAPSRRGLARDEPPFLRRCR